jgi:hypothetical protein
MFNIYSKLLLDQSLVTAVIYIQGQRCPASLVSCLYFILKAAVVLTCIKRMSTRQDGQRRFVLLLAVCLARRSIANTWLKKDFVNIYLQIIPWSLVRVDSQLQCSMTSSYPDFFGINSSTPKND